MNQTKNVIIRGKQIVFKSKKLFILAIFVLGVTMLAGAVFAEEEQPVQTEQTEQAAQTKTNMVVVTETGTLKSFDLNTGTLVINTVNGSELELKITNASNIEISGSLSDLNSLELQVGAKVSVEFQAETKIINVITIEPLN